MCTKYFNTSITRTYTQNSVIRYNTTEITLWCFGAVSWTTEKALEALQRPIPTVSKSELLENSDKLGVIPKIANS